MSLFRKERKTKSTMYALPVDFFSDLMPKDVNLGFETNPYVFSAVDAIASSAMRVDWLVKSKKDHHVVDESETNAVNLYKILKYPNEITTNATMINFMMKDLLSNGVTIWEIAKNRMGKASGLYRMLYSKTQIDPDPKKYIKQFIYNNGETKLKPEEVLYIRIPSPRDAEELKGFSPLEAGAKQIKLAAYEKVFEMSYFKHGGVPSMILYSTYPFDDETYQKLKEKFSSELSGAENAFKFLIVDGNEFKKIELSSKLMDIPLKDLDNVLRSQLLAVFRVPENVIGLSMNSTKASAQSVIVQFWQSVVIPYLKLIKEAFNQQICERYFPDYYIDFDLTVIEELQAYKADISEKISRLFLNGIITKNEARTMLGLPPTPDGDVFQQPLNSTLLDKNNKIILAGGKNADKQN